jgi:hypothetical protein
LSTQTHSVVYVPRSAPIPSTSMKLCGLTRKASAHRFGVLQIDASIAVPRRMHPQQHEEFIWSKFLEAINLHRAHPLTRNDFSLIIFDPEKDPRGFCCSDRAVSSNLLIHYAESVYGEGAIEVLLRRAVTSGDDPRRDKVLKAAIGVEMIKLFLHLDGINAPRCIPCFTRVASHRAHRAKVLSIFKKCLC